MSRLTTEQIQDKLSALKAQEKKLLAEVKKANDRVVFAVGKLIADNPTLLTPAGIAEVAKIFPAIKKAPEVKPATPTPASTQSNGGN